jgi:hypothetical protein
VEIVQYYRSFAYAQDDKKRKELRMTKKERTQDDKKRKELRMTKKEKNSG